MPRKWQSRLAVMPNLLRSLEDMLQMWDKQEFSMIDIEKARKYAGQGRRLLRNWPTKEKTE